MNRLVKIFLVNIAVVICLFLLIEFILYIAYPEIKLSGTEQKLLLDSVYYDSPGLKPNSKGVSNGVLKSVDQYGFWKYNLHQRNIEKKILLLGDSVTMGIGVDSDSTFAGLISSSLTSSTILNSALIGYASKDYKNIITKLFVENKNAMKISSVIIFWCLNDVYPNHFVEQPGINTNGVFSVVVTFLRTNSKLFHLLKYIFSDRPRAYFQYDKKFYDVNSDEFHRSVLDVVEISKTLKDNSIELHIVLLPYEYQLRINDNLPQQMLSNELSKYEISTYNLMDELSKISYDYSDLYMYGDGIHFSNQGHNKISDILINKTNLFE